MSAVLSGFTRKTPWNHAWLRESGRSNCMKRGGAAAMPRIFLLSVKYARTAPPGLVAQEAFSKGRGTLQGDTQAAAGESKAVRREARKRRGVPDCVWH